jgi:hypothetical protein
VDQPNPFYVPPQLDLLGAWVQRFRSFWVALGRLEAFQLAEQLATIPLSAPCYVCGLARSGSTLLHEILAAHPGVGTHRIKDFPLAYIPSWWRRALAGQAPSELRERAHGDRMLVNADSPDAVEEMVWMAFFPRCHDPAVSNVLDGDRGHPSFERYYRDHLRKLLLVEGGRRYVAKANYHIARLGYLLRLFPDARFLIPVREPVSHIGSLMRQHRRFCDGERRHRRALTHMRRLGHFEFGLDRRPIHLGDDRRVQQVRWAWKRGEEVRGWALYWAMVHEYLAQVLDGDARLRAAAHVVRYEDLCAAPAAIIAAALKHCDLTEVDRLVAAFAPKVERPDYYKSGLSAADVELIHQETAAAAALWGYG